MSNSYFNYSPTITPYTLARAEAVAAQFMSVQVGFDALPAPDVIAQGRIGYLSDTGTANTIVTAYPTAPSGYANGMTLSLLVAASNTGPTTINVNGLGPKSVLRADGAAIQAGDLPAGAMATFEYDGTAFRVTGGGAVAMNERALAQAAAASALMAPGTSATSTSSVALGTGSKSFNIQPGKLFVRGQTMVAADAVDPNNQLTGIVTAHDNVNGVITVNSTGFSGTGTKSSWILALSANAIATYGSVVGAGLATGGGSTAGNQTITVAAAAFSDVLAGTSASVAVTPKSIADAAGFLTLTDAATVNWNTNLAFNAAVILGGNRTIAAPTNLKDGWTYTLKLIQDGTGSRLPTWNVIWDWGADGAPVLSTGAGKADYVTALYDAGASKLIANFRKAA